MFLGIDIGTSSAKALVIDADGLVLRTGSATYPLSRPREGWSEQDPADWWAGAVQATRDACATLDARAIQGVGLSGQMHGAVLLPRGAADAAKSGPVRALRPAVLWNDQRTAAQCREIEQRLGGRAACVKAVGNAPLPGFTLPKLLWVREHEPDVWAKMALVLTPKDYIGLLMTGDAAIDVGDASGTLLLDVVSRDWSDGTCAAMRIDRATLPRVLESAASRGGLSEWAAAALGLAPGIPVAAGSGDNQAGAAGAGVVSPETAMLSLGTSGVLYVHADRPRLDIPRDGHAGRAHTFCAADGDAKSAGGWCNTGCMLSAAGSLEWARNVLAPDLSFDAVITEAAKAPSGSEGLFFLPHLSGERCPHPDPGATGAWVGLTARHTRAHLFRSVLEGVALTMRQVLEIMRGMGLSITRIRVGGGGARSSLWRQIHADALGVEIVSMQTEEGPALGAALLGGVCAGKWTSVREACNATLRETESLLPRDRSLEGLLPRFSSLYPALHERPVHSGA